MKFISVFWFLAIFRCTLGQRVAIGYPADGAHVSAGSNITVEVDRPNTLSSSQEVAVIIALQSCAASCSPPASLLGRILYNGPYNPQLHLTDHWKPPHQNFTIFIPANTRGMVQLGISHFSLIGAGPEPFLENLNITLNVK